jgi:hypothetical protein
VAELSLDGELSEPKPPAAALDAAAPNPVLLPAVPAKDPKAEGALAAADEALDAAALRPTVVVEEGPPNGDVVVAAVIFVLAGALLFVYECACACVRVFCADRA